MVNEAFQHKEFADKYEDHVNNQKWYGPEILFGMVYEFIQPGHKILDLGIGTGLSAKLFKKAGLEVYGLDYSKAMLEKVREKNIAVDLKAFDLTKTPLPYDDNFFHHISANAVLYFLGEMDDLFKEISRITKKNGIFSFIFEEETQGVEKIKEKFNPVNGIMNYKHSKDYILTILEKNNFTVLREAEFINRNFQGTGKSADLSVYVCKK